MSARTYVVGLPVVATVDDSGWVTVDVDTAELGVAKVLREHTEHSDDQVTRDAEVLAAWAASHQVSGEGF